MSSSIRRSSDYETDEILPEDTEEKVGVDGDQTLTDSDDVEETEKDGNNYQYDGFVVPDDFDEEGTEEFEETEQESVRKRRKRKQKDYRLDKDDTDLLEENVNASHNDRFKRLKKARKDETEDDGLLDDEEDEDDHSAYRKEQRIQSSQDLRLINQLFNDGTELEDNEKLMLGDGDEMDVEKTDNYAGIFEPEEIQEKYQTEEDRLIIEKDLPERLQLRFKNRPMPDNPELIEETNWLVERIMLKNNITSKESVSLKSKVHKVLEYLRLAGCEIMYIWTHKKHEITSDKKAEFEKHEYELKLSDLWYIYDLDMEWMHIYQRRKYIKNLLEKLESFLPTTKSLKSSFQSTYDLKVLQYYLDYVEFHLKKFVDDQELRQLVGEDMDDFDQKEPAFKRIRKRNFARECMKYHLHDVANQIAIAPDHLSENLVYSDQKNKPKLITETPDKIATEYSNPDVAIIDQPVKTLTTLCEYMALELYNHPMIRKQLRKTYNEKVTISTKPTDKGQNEVTIYNFYYPCKRIKNMKPLDFGNSLWLMMIEAEMKGLIEISLKLPWQKDGEKDEQKVEKKDEIRQRLLNLYLHDPKGKKTEPEEMNSINAWNIVREETISKLLKSFIYPSFERALKEELTESSERYVVNSAARAFKDSINIQPYKKKKADGESEPDPGPYRVLSCIIEPQTSNAHFVQVDENGELMDHMTCKYLARHPSDDYSLRQLYNKERETLKNFMVKSYPGLIVIGATCLACKKVKIDLGNLAEEALNEIKARDPTSTATVPWVMWGLTSVPNAFAQSYKASKQFPDFEFHVKEAISLGRLVQDPLAETLNLWAERIKENSLLYISYHTMQHMVNPAKLRNEFEKYAMEICNDVGVDINRVIRHKHLGSTLQFICGLGVRKAMDLVDKISHEMVGGVHMRQELFNNVVQRNVYINCIGFIKIKDVDVYSNNNNDMDVLDMTRIHPDFYQMAKKISKEAVDDSKDDPRDVVQRVMENPKRLEDLDLEDYAKHLGQRGKSNMMVMISFVVEELTKPFQDPRAEWEEKFESASLFYKLTRESKFNLRDQSIATVRITKIDSRSVTCVTDSGVPGMIPMNELRDKQINPSLMAEGELSKYYHVGEYLKAKVKSIDFERFRLTMTTNNLVDQSKFLTNNKILAEYGLSENSTFTIEKGHDYLSVITADREKKQSRYTPRRINHPKFKNMSLMNAQEYLNEREVGDFVIRPSSKGPSHLNITWKLANEKIVHLDIKEGMKGQHDMISRHLTLDSIVYESLDEIIERYIKPSNILVNQIREHKKFMDEDMEYVKATLIDEKKGEPTVIPYYINFSSQIPQYLVLSYIPKHYDTKHEYIKIKPDGLLFHDLKFTSIKKLIAWFKSKLKTAEYQKYVKSVQIPDAEFGSRRVKEEGVKQEGYGSRYAGKSQKDSVKYKGGKSQKDMMQKKKPRNHSDEENKGFMKPKKRQGENTWAEGDDWEAPNIDENRENWVSDWGNRGKLSQGKTKVKREGSRSRSRSNEKQKMGDAKGKRSAISKNSFASEHLHMAWGQQNTGEETWDNLEQSNDNWTKSEIKTENEHEWGHSTKNEDGSSLYQNKENDSSNWG